MQWSDEAIVLSVKPYGETSAVTELFTREHGRHLGLVHGGRSRKARPVLQIGNQVDAVWHARLAEHLGTLTLEPRRAFAAEVLDEPTALAALASIAALARLLPERDPHPSLYEITVFVLSFLDDASVWPALVVRWELALLGGLGFGLDLATCAATGATSDLIHVSPKSGRAVSAAAGAPYKDRLLTLPQFLVDGNKRGQASKADVLAGFALTGHFLETRVLAQRGETLPAPRHRLVEVLSTKWRDQASGAT